MSVITTTELQAWMGVTTSIDTAIAQEVIDATEERLTQRCTLPAEWTSDVRIAAKIQAARLYKRRQTPEGVAQFGDVGVMRISRLDPDVEDMLTNYLRWSFA